jgi:hypothetical protein
MSSGPQILLIQILSGPQIRFFGAAEGRRGARRDSAGRGGPEGGSEGLCRTDGLPTFFLGAANTILLNLTPHPAKTNLNNLDMKKQHIRIGIRIQQALNEEPFVFDNKLETFFIV